LSYANDTALLGYKYITDMFMTNYTVKILSIIVALVLVVLVGV
jgi:hypothetical protein